MVPIALPGLPKLLRDPLSNTRQQVSASLQLRKLSLNELKKLVLSPILGSW